MTEIDFDREKMDAMADQLRLGCETTRRQMIEGYMPLAHSKVKKWLQLYPGLAYLEEDMVSEGFVGIVQAIDTIGATESPEHSNVTAYVSVAIINAIGQFLENGDFIRVPRSSDEDCQTIEPIFESTLEGSLETGEMEVRDILDTICTTDEERAVVDMLSKGYTEREVASQLDMPNVTVHMLRVEIHERYIRLEQR